MMRTLGFTLRDVKSKMVAEANEDDQFGAKLKKIGPFVPGEDQDGAWVRVVTGRERYNGDWQARAAKWLPWEDAEEPEEPEEPAEEEDDEEAVEEDEEIEDTEEEPEAEPEPPVRGRRSATKAPAKKAAATKPAARGRAAAAPAKKAASRPARGRRPSTVEDDEPPF
jgi:hypothetical protein